MVLAGTQLDGVFTLLFRSGSRPSLIRREVLIALVEALGVPESRRFDRTEGLTKGRARAPPKSSASDSSAASCHFPSFPVAKVYDRKASSWSARKGLAELVSRFLPGQGTHGSVSASSFRSASVS